MKEALSDRTVARLANDLDRGQSSPTSCHTAPAITARECERIFRRDWQLVGSTDQLLRVGEFVTSEAGDSRSSCAASGSCADS